MENERLRIGMTVVHFKNPKNKYVIMYIGNMMDCSNGDTTRKVVIYQPLYKASKDGTPLMFIRDYDDFMSEVDREKYPDVEQQYRFEPYLKDKI